jgi:hypothetical protein
MDSLPLIPGNLDTLLTYSDSRYLTFALYATVRKVNDIYVRKWHGRSFRVLSPI